MRTRFISALLFSAALVAGPLTDDRRRATPSLPTETGCAAARPSPWTSSVRWAGTTCPSSSTRKATTTASSAATPCRTTQYNKLCPDGICGVPVIYNFRDNDLPARQ